jgi:hypothetical protein
VRPPASTYAVYTHVDLPAGLDERIHLRQGVAIISAARRG